MPKNKVFDALDKTFNNVTTEIAERKGGALHLLQKCDRFQRLKGDGHIIVLTTSKPNSQDPYQLKSRPEMLAKECAGVS